MNDSIIVCNTGSDYLSKVELNKNKVEKLIFNRNDNSIGANNIIEEGQYFFTANNYNDSISIFDKGTMKEMKKIIIGGSPKDLLIDKDNIYVVCGDANTMIKYDIKEDGIILDLKVGNWPQSISKNEKYIFIANLGSDTVTVIGSESNEIIREIKALKYPSKVLISKNNKFLYICESYLGDDKNGYIEIIDIDTLSTINRIMVGVGPTDMYECNNILYVTNLIDGTINFINLESQKLDGCMYIGGMPKAILKQNEALYVTDYIRSKMYIIERNEIKKIIAVGSEPNAMILI